MLFQLRNTSTNTIREVKPSGNYSFVTRRDNHRYYESLEGGIIFTGDDFAWIMEEGECVEFELTCNFRKTWKGLFTQADASMIDLSKRQMEVTPRHDDDYSKIEGWMGIDLNILPPYKDYKAMDIRMPVQYEIEREVVRIDQPYEGQNAGSWKGYSVNDWIRDGDQNYRQLNARRNSLFYEMTKDIDDLGVVVPYGAPLGAVLFTTDVYVTRPTFPGWTLFWGYNYEHDQYSAPNLNPGSISGYNIVTSSRESDNHNLVFTLSGFKRYMAGGTLLEYLFQNRKPDSAYHTLTEVINYFDDDDNWEFCELVYEREIYKGGRPPSGKIYSDGDPVGWRYFEDEDIWIRKPLAFGEELFTTYDLNNTQVIELSLQYGNGYWFTDLIEIQLGNRKIMKQVLYRNWKYYQQYSGTDLWYTDSDLYPIRTFKIAHKITDIIKKFLLFIKDEQEGKEGIVPHDFEFDSKFFEESRNPVTNLPPNSFSSLFAIQNSDMKRPTATEKATKQEYTFEAFLNIVCDFFNLGWAVIDGKFVVEHIKYFENGLTYDPDIPESMLLNPYSIKNTALSKNFMEFSDIYNFDKSKMPKFELFQTVGGEEPTNNKTRIEYFGGCVNNKPRENTNEITIDSTTDVRFTQTEGADAGITLAFAEYSTIFDRYTFNAKPCETFGRFSFNNFFTLEKIVERYHFWGRSRNEASLNGEDWTSLTPSKNILQTIHFPLQKDNEQGEKLLNSPYIHVLTGIGEGIVKQVEYNPRQNMLEFQLGFGEVNPYALPPDVVLDWYIHEQTNPSTIWDVQHQMNYGYIMRPVVFDMLGNEIEYNDFFIAGGNQVTLSFSESVAGRAHFIALRVASGKRHVHYQGASSKTWTINHDLGVDFVNIAITAVLDNDNREIKYSSLEVVSNNQVKITFTEPTVGRVALADVSSYTTNHERNISDDGVGISITTNRVHNKPIVLMAGEEIFYNSHQLLYSLRQVGFSEQVTAKIIVKEKVKT